LALDASGDPVTDDHRNSESLVACSVAPPEIRSILGRVWTAASGELIRDILIFFRFFFLRGDEATEQ
jgi:hypothetical protein